MITFGGLLLLAADLWALFRCWGSTLSATSKFFWTLLIIFFPFGGLVLFWNLSFDEFLTAGFEFGHGYPFAQIMLSAHPDTSS